MRVLTHHAIRTILHLSLIIQTSLLGVSCAKVAEVQEESISQYWLTGYAKTCDALPLSLLLTPTMSV